MSRPPIIEPDHSDPTLLLDRDQAEQLRHLLGTIEDWLLHCGDEALDDLGGFLAGLGWAPFAPRERLIASVTAAPRSGW